MKAAFLLNFTKFVDWPAGAFADCRFALHHLHSGETTRSAARWIEMRAGETVNGRKLAVRRIDQASRSASLPDRFYRQRAEKKSPEFWAAWARVF